MTLIAITKTLSFCFYWRIYFTRRHILCQVYHNSLTLESKLCYKATYTSWHAWNTSILCGRQNPSPSMVLIVNVWWGCYPLTFSSSSWLHGELMESLFTFYTVGNHDDNSLVTQVNQCFLETKRYLGHSGQDLAPLGDASRQIDCFNFVSSHGKLNALTFVIVLTLAPEDYVWIQLCGFTRPEVRWSRYH